MFTASAGLFALNVQRLARYARLGLPDDRTNDPRTRIRNLLSIGIAQSKIFREEPAGLMHATIFWGFVVLTAGTVEIMVQGVFRGFSFDLFLPKPLYFLYSFSQDAFAALVIAAVAFALYRRLVIHPTRLEGDKLEHTDAIIILSLIGGLMVTLLLANACAYLGATGGNIGPEKVVSRAVAGVIAPSVTNAPAFATGFWWSHVLLVLIFLNYLPYSKHLHVVTSLFNVYLSNTSGPGTRGAMKPMDLEAENAQFGAADVEQLTWKNLLDGYSCTECGRCTAACPANITGKPLSPRKIVINTRQRLMEKGPVATGDWMAFKGPALAHETAAVASAEAGESGEPSAPRWLHNGRGALGVHELPRVRAGVPGVDRPARDHQRAAAQPRAVGVALSGRDSARVRVAGAERLAVGVQPGGPRRLGARNERPHDGRDGGAWRAPRRAVLGRLHGIVRRSREEDHRRVRENPRGLQRQLRDPRPGGALPRRPGAPHGQRVPLSDAGQGHDRDARPLPRADDRDELPALLPPDRQRVSAARRQLRRHPPLDVHRAASVGASRAAGDREGRRLTVAYHDSCYLGRYNDIYDAPRETLRRALPVVELLEPKRTRDRGLCCGAGGGRMFMEERTGKRINVERTEELLALEPDRIAVACPFCMTMMSDGVKAVNSTVPVVDIAEVVAERLATT